MKTRLFVAALFLTIAGIGLFGVLTSPQVTSVAEVSGLVPGDKTRGERMFWAGGCASCHARPKTEGEDRLVLAGGLELKTPFGTFVAPNISPHETDGIGSWSVTDLANAMRNGVSPDGRHYYPAFPYASYVRMENSDIADLYSFLMTLPATNGRAPDHKIGFPFNIRRGLGLWKLAFLSKEQVFMPGNNNTEAEKGRYLVEGPGHCGECHTPRNFAGGIDKSMWLSGAPAAEGDGKVPNITSGEGGIGDWSANDIAYFLETGFTPEFDSVGGAMTSVQRNMAHLSPQDRSAIAAYLKSVPPLASSSPK